MRTAIHQRKVSVLSKVSVRPATLVDITAVGDFLDICGRHYRGGSLRDQAQQRLARPGSDAVVVVQEGAVVGFAQVWRDGDEVRCFARVHPAHIGHGVGTALLRHVMALARERHPVEEFTVTQWSTDAAGSALLRGLGFTERRHFLRMVTMLGADHVQPGPLPAGVQIGAFEPATESAALYRAWLEAFAPEHPEEDEWWRERRDDPAVDFHPDRWLLAHVGAELVGFSLGRIENAIGYIGDIGVRPQWRGRGIGYALLTRSLAAFAVEGLPEAYLNVDVDNVTHAVRLYHKAGMQAEPSYVIWGRSLADANRKVPRIFVTSFGGRSRACTTVPLSGLARLAAAAGNVDTARKLYQ
jgi:mycothiol synthase